MPELPEVEVVRRGLAAHVLGRTIEGVEVLHPRAVRRQLEGPAHFEAVLAGRRFTGTGRRGKFLWLATDDPDVVLAAHLGMSGQFRVESADPVHRHARVRLDLGDRTLWFVDQRTFGWVGAFPMVADRGGVLVPVPVRDIAADPTDPRFDVRAVATRLRTHRVEIKRLLLDQSHVSGIGNIYADEALWAAGVHARRRADRLSVAVLVRVLEAATEVMAASLVAGGTSFDSLYVNVNGQSGYFGRGLSVYGRAGLPCPRCDAPIVRERFMNRSSHFCPRCQSAPRSAH
ncbi:MAG: bifunctional DNA-formamidopyrimidine glycosylase/DNA-(apurinic or apyrimidinic site) lyase [Candidatus Nanopelagicales bacterium]